MYAFFCNVDGENTVIAKYINTGTYMLSSFLIPAYLN